MNFLCKLVMVLVCGSMLVSASEGVSHENDLERMSTISINSSADIYESKNAHDEDVEANLQELETGTRRSGDAAEGDINNKILGSSWFCRKNLPYSTKWLYGGAAVSWATSLALIVYECGYGACDASSGVMVGAYVLLGLGAVFAARGYCLFNVQNKESLLS